MRSFSRILCFAAFATAVYAQVPGQGSVELGLYSGATYGIGNYGLMAGGNVSYAVNKYILPYVEYSYFPHLEREVTGTIQGSSVEYYRGDYTLAAHDFHGGVHLRVPIRESRFVPYGVFGIGVLGTSDQKINVVYYNSQSDFNSNTNPHPLPTPLTSSGGGNLAINFGGGMRFYVHSRFGLRVEVKGYKPFGEPVSGGEGFGRTFLKAEGGVFFQLR